MNKNINIAGVAAFCVGHRGIGKNGKLPWPHLREDYKFYTDLCKTTRDPKKKNGIIMGKYGWRTWEDDKKSNPKMLTVITSTSLPTDEPMCLGVARSFDEAIHMFFNPPTIDDLESIYILGGAKNYQLCLSHPRCSRLVMTRIYQDFESDTFFPEFEHLYHRISHPNIDDMIREDPTTGIKFRFEVWEKNSS